MYLAQSFAIEMEQFKNQMLKAYESKLTLHPDLPPLNIFVAQMNTQQRNSFYYWLARAKNEFIYIQLTNRQGQTYHTRYLQGNEQLDDFYISKIESSSRQLKISERLEIQAWIMERQQFTGVMPKNLEHAIHVETQQIKLQRVWGKWILLWGIASVLAGLILWRLGLGVFTAGLLLSMIKYQHLQKFKKEVKKEDWSKSILSQLSVHIQNSKQQQFKEYYQLADATVSQYDDHNLIQHAAQHNFTELVARIESVSLQHRSQPLPLKQQVDNVTQFHS